LKFFEQAFDVRFHRALGNPKLFSDDLVAFTFRNDLENIQLTRAQYGAAHVFH
jgi:hypothetical protein